MERKTKIIIAITASAFLLLVVYGIITLITGAGKESVKVYLIPNDALLTANGERISSGTAHLKPGTYEVEASRPGFKSYKETLTIGQSNTTDIDIALAGVSAEAKRWEAEHQKLYREKEGREGVRAVQRGTKMVDTNPIITKLPYENLLYTIGYRKDPADPSGTAIVLEIDASSGYRRAALQKIRDLGFDPTEYKINFRNYENPFDNE